jgi:hypothetical protein
MDLKRLISEFQEQQKTFQSINKLLRELSRLDQNSNENLPRIRQAISTLKDVANSVQMVEASAHNLTNWISQYELEVTNAEEEIRKQFGAELEKELRKSGLSLSGQYPELKAGLFTIELDFDKWKAKLWYGPKQEHLVQCPLSVSKIASRLEKERQQLGSQLPENQLLEKIGEAYYRAVGMKRGEDAPIIRVLAELSYLLQSTRFLQDPKRENYRSYSRPNFSYDLFRIQRFQKKDPSLSKIHLTTATRAHTKRRSDFLWVPDDENGKGTAYSHLRFEEV